MGGVAIMGGWVGIFVMGVGRESWVQTCGRVGLGVSKAVKPRHPVVQVGLHSLQVGKVKAEMQRVAEAVQQDGRELGRSLGNVSHPVQLTGDWVRQAEHSWGLFDME